MTRMDTQKDRKAKGKVLIIPPTRLSSPKHQSPQQTTQSLPTTPIITRLPSPEPEKTRPIADLERQPVLITHPTSKESLQAIANANPRIWLDVSIGGGECIHVPHKNELTDFNPWPHIFPKTEPT